ncbi:MAG: DNA translocase FtsK 4TM domain-containing protein [Myxococcota bacterium]|nr:DNA translocase FtsK 4TM domain-containing protein [Myxococcota bacterium]
MGAKAEAAATPRKSRVATKKKAPAKQKRRAADHEVEALKNEMLGIAIAVACLAVFLALISFYPEDVTKTGSAATTGRTHNLIGPVGASIANIILAIFGLAGFLLPITFVLPGLCFLTGRKLRIRLTDALAYPALILCCAMAAHLWLETRTVLGHLPGGWIGAHGAEILRSFFGTTGAYLLIYSVLALTFVMSTGISLVAIVKKAIKPMWEWFASKVGQMSTALRRLPGRIWVDVQDIWSNRTRASTKSEKTDESKIKTSRAQEPKITDRRNAIAEKETKAATSNSVTDESNLQEPPEKRSIFSLKRSKSDENRESGVFTMGDSSIAEPAVDIVHDVDDIGVQFDDPMDAKAVQGHGDTVLGTAAVTQPPSQMESHGSTSREERKPVVNRRRNKETPPEEQIEIPLPEGLKCEGYRLPPLHFLDYDNSDQVEIDPDFLQAQATRLVEALATFKIEGRVTEIHPGPVVTMYEFEPAPGVRISKIAGLSDDLAMALKAFRVRIVAPIPGKGAVGFEVPNQSRETVYIKEIIGAKAFTQKKHNLPMVLGKNIHGEPVVTDLSKMPHLLVAGTTGSGKSVGVNCMITSLLYHCNPEECRFIMVDPKMLELSIYEGIPHLLLPVVTDPKKASMALKWAVDEMERRYELMKNAGVRDLRGYNRRVEKELAEAEAAQLRAKANALDPNFDASGHVDTDSNGAVDRVEPNQLIVEETPQKLPYLVVVIDEFADLMMVAGKEVELCVARIAQKARAAGIHLILATQRPSTDVITGLIKANFPTRIAFQVSSGIDSRTVLNTIGAENLLGKGDMLFMPPGSSKLTRVHGAFVSEEEISGVVEFIKEQAAPDYLDESILLTDDEKDDLVDNDDVEMDEMYEEAVRVVARDGRASTSHLQRRLSLGYNRAARIVDQMERDGLVGPSRGAKPREVNKALIHELVNRWDGGAAQAVI